jgi:nucleoside phosphorylase
LVEHLKDLTERILNNSLQGRDFFNAYPEIHRELLKLEPQQFDVSKRTDFMLARAAFEHLVNPNKHETITGSMVQAAASKLRPVLDHFIVSKPLGPGKPRPDLLLVTVNDHETRAILDVFREATGRDAIPIPLEGRLYLNLGVINGTTVYHALSEMGSSGPGAMHQAVDKAIRALDPGAVIAVGIAFGVSEDKQSLGDILVSRQLQLYDLQRVGSRIILRGDKPHAAPRLINHFVVFKQVKWTGQKVVFGLILSGEKLIDNADYRDQLVELQTEAEGGEMEGAGLYVSSAEHKVDWIVIKAICDWADGNKGVNKQERQRTAATNAAVFLVESLKYAALKRIDSVTPPPTLNTAGSNPAGSRSSSAADRDAELLTEMQELMPEIIDGIRELLNEDQLLREIVVMEKSSYAYRWPRPHGKFCDDTHPDASRKFQILESHGLVRRVNRICYELSPRFVRMLREQS